MGKAEDNSASVAGEMASTSFCWTYGGKEGREVFELETKISGTLSEIDIENHIASAIRTMSAVFRHGGRAKWGGFNPAGRMEDASDGEGAGSNAFEWGRTRSGQRVLLMDKSGSEPEEVECPTHAGKTMKKRSNEGGSWLSHKEGDSYCIARIQRRGVET